MVGSPTTPAGDPRGNVPLEAAAAADRRAARKKARLSAPPPEPQEEFTELSLADLRTLHRELSDYETRVSYWRRLVQARMDLISAGRQPDDIGRLAQALADAPGRGRRIANLDVMPPDQVPPLPGLEDLWQYAPGDDEQQVAEYLTRLGQIERELSAHRHGLHERIDALHHELIARYRQNPALALSALPDTAS